MPSKEEIRQNVTKWIEALRSGDYQQGMAFLRKGEVYCCLGVAVEVLYGHHVWKKYEDTMCVYSYGDSCQTFLHYMDKEKLGLILDNHTKLINMNDRECLTFPEIADWIERNVLIRL